jgi:AbrB family looped-hinge helix DNA binding protein
METSIVSSKGQIVIPKRYRKKDGFKPGTKVVFSEDAKGNLIIKALNKAYFESFAGILKGKGDVLAELMKEKQWEIKHDENRL